MDKDEKSKLKLNVKEASVKPTKEAFQDEFRETTVEKGKKDDDEEKCFEELWQRFWEAMTETEFKKCEWTRIENVHKYGPERKRTEDKSEMATEQITLYQWRRTTNTKSAVDPSSSWTHPYS